MKLIFEHIYEDDRELIFDPPLEVEVVWADSSSADIYWDFGMYQVLGYENFITTDFKTREDKLRKIIEFELFHSFFHCCEDPNYTYINWALYGNLKERTKKVENC